MTDYIKRDELAKIVRRYFSENYITDGDWHADGLLREIDDVPAADVVEVVRCKDCKYCEIDCEYGLITYYACNIFCSMVNPDGYCSYGERRGDGECTE